MKKAKNGRYSKRFTRGIYILLSVFILSISGCKPSSDAVTTEVKTSDISSEKLSPEMLVEKINTYRTEVDNGLSKYAKKEVVLSSKNIKPGIKEVWEKLEGYYNQNKLVKMKMYPKPQYSKRAQEFYIQNGKLLFALDKDERQKMGDPKAESPGNLYYFSNKILVKYILYSGPDAKMNDLERKLHELQLTYEAYEFMDILINN